MLRVVETLDFLENENDYAYRRWRGEGQSWDKEGSCDDDDGVEVVFVPCRVEDEPYAAVVAAAVEDEEVGKDCK